MTFPQEQSEQIEALRGLIERLSAPDLTLAEATILRGRMAALLERQDRPGPSGAVSPSSARGDATLHEPLWSPEPTIRVAG